MLQVSATDTGRIAQYETKDAAHVAKAKKKHASEIMRGKSSTSAAEETKTT